MTASTTIFEINGVIDTEKTVWNNMELIAAAAASWISYDNTTGQYGVVINKPDTPVASFNDNNIIGAITLTETDYENIYNACEISFPNRDMFSRTDFIRFDEGVAARFDYEPDNTLTLSSDLIRDSVQADVLAITELKQSRQNKVISFSSDFTALAINPGDVIRITNDYWGWSNKLFRVTQMVEEDRDDGSIVVNITAIEYSDDVYAYNSITRFDRSTSTGIPSAEGNATTKAQKTDSFAADTTAVIDPTYSNTSLDTAITQRVVNVNVAEGYPSYFSAFTFIPNFKSIYNNNTTIVDTKQVGSGGKELRISFTPPSAIYYRLLSDGTTYEFTENSLPMAYDLLYSSSGSTGTYSVADYTHLLNGENSTEVNFTIINPAAGYWQLRFSKYIYAHEGWTVAAAYPNTDYPLVGAIYFPDAANPSVGYSGYVKWSLLQETS